MDARSVKTRAKEVWLEFWGIFFVSGPWTAILAGCQSGMQEVWDPRCKSSAGTELVDVDDRECCELHSMLSRVCAGIPNYCDLM